MTTLREAAQMALDALEHLQTDIEWQYKSPTRAMLRKVEKALRAALAADKPSADRLAQPKQEPVAWELNEVILNSISDSSEVVAPPQREWIGLTDEEIEAALSDMSSMQMPFNKLILAIARAIEAKLREKNSPQ